MDDVMKCVRRLFVGLALTATAWTPCRAQDAERELLMRGRDLAADEVTKLEQTASDNPDDLSSRVQLLGHYFDQIFSSPDANAAHQKLVLWLIDRHPDSTLHQQPETHILDSMNPAGYTEAKRLWIETVKANDRNAQVAANAADFFLLSDPAAAEGLLIQAEQIEPDSTKWIIKLGHLYELRSHRARGDKKLILAKKALDEFERALDKLDDQQTFFLLADVAALAFDSGDDEKAKKYATQLLERNKEAKNNWNSGNAIHHGNLILGRVALRGGDVEQAKAHLLQAGATSGSPQLNSFGPNMALAKELLEKGERDVVLEYFGLCAKFWDRKELKTWAADVHSGASPDFGANLVY
jgi:tetratricopeptide (TPR) repeat protein